MQKYFLFRQALLLCRGAAFLVAVVAAILGAVFVVAISNTAIAFAQQQGATTVASNEQPRTLRILNWEEYLSPSVIEIWRQRTGVDVEQVLFDNDEIRDLIVLSGDTQGIDIAMLDEPASRIFGNSGKIIDLDKASIKNSNLVAERWHQQCGVYSMPYMWGTLGIAYRSDKVSPAPTSWRDLIQPAEYLKGHIGMMNDYVDTLAPSLLLRNESIDSDDENLLREVFNELVAQEPYVLTYEYGITFMGVDARAGDLYMAQVYSGDEYTMDEFSGSQGVWKYVIPEEGTILWVDCLAILSGSKNIALAKQFIEFLNEPEIAALNSEDIYIATANSAALPLLSEEFRNDKTAFPSQTVLDTSQLYRIMEKGNITKRDRMVGAILNRFHARTSRAH